MSNILPKYVVVACTRFGQGTPGWRLHEVDAYCFAESYIVAKDVVERWKSEMYSGLSFMVKYENWLAKGGSLYDGKPFLEKRSVLTFSGY